MWYLFKIVTQIDGQTNRQRQTDKQTNRQTDKQTQVSIGKPAPQKIVYLLSHIEPYW